MSILISMLCRTWRGEERAGCFTLIVFLMSCYGSCTVDLPRGAVEWLFYTGFTVHTLSKSK